MLAVPDRQPIGERQQLAFNGFVQQLVVETGWRPGPPTNFWIVGYDPNAEAVANRGVPMAAWASPSSGLDLRAKHLLELALSCQSLSTSFDHAEAALKQLGWQPDQGEEPITLSSPVHVYGFRVRKIAVARERCEQVYRSFFQGVGVQQLIAAASLKLGRDGKQYGRVTPLGVLTLDKDQDGLTLTCSVDSEG